MLLAGSDEAWKHDFYEDCGADADEKTGFHFDLRGENGRA
jgi:hypothetical protein